jgi:hypothetical protein
VKISWNLLYVLVDIPFSSELVKTQVGFYSIDMNYNISVYGYSFE